MKTDRSFIDQIRTDSSLRTYLLEQWLEQLVPLAPGGLSPAADPTQSANTKRQGLERDVNISYGCIVDAIAYTGWYKVQLERGGATIPCSDLLQTGLGPIGARQLSTYPPGTGVYVLKNPQANHGVIMGTVPDFMLNPKHANSDFIVQGGNTGLHVDYVHQFPFNLRRKGGITDWSTGRPFDGLPVGSWGSVSDTGIMMYLDSYMAQLRVDEETGLFMFYRDQLTRLAGHNLQIRSAGHMREDYDDQQEFDHESAWNAYLWEARGAFVLGEQIWRPYGSYDVQVITPYFSYTEPLFDDLQPIHRHRLFKGYLGQGQKRTLYLLPAIIPSFTKSYVPHLDKANPKLDTPVSITSKVERFSHESMYRNVSEENWDQDGHVGIRSAKGVIVSKRMIQPSPKRMKLPEDPAGETAPNYRFNGRIEYGPLGVPHLVGDITDVGVNDQLIHAAAFMDAYAHCFNWKGLHQFHYHASDWYLPDESDMVPEAPLMPDGIPDFIDLECNQYLPRPDPIQMYVDERYGNVVYFPNNSYLALLDDGGVLLGDGWGSEIRMTGGHIFNTAPADIWNKAGRNVNNWAGFDAIVRANNCVDISANKRDVRIKADINCYILAGNEVCGGVLIESRAPNIAFKLFPDDEQITGVTLKAKDSIVGIHAPNILLTRCNSEKNGMIMIDADDEHDIVTKSKGFRRHLAESAIDFIGDTVYEYWDDHCIIGTGLEVWGPAYITECLGVSNNIIATGIIAPGGYGTITPAAIAELATAFENLSDRIVYLTVTFEPLSVTDATWVQDTTDFCTIEFWFRSSAQDRTDPFVLFEDRWQQMARLAGKPTIPWSERPVSYQGVPTYPHPGKTAWLDTPALRQIDLTMFDMAANLCEDREPVALPYEIPVYDTPAAVVLDGIYAVVCDPCVPCP